MINRVKSGIVSGIKGRVVDIEVDISKGIPSFSIVGLAGAEVRESKERVRSAISNSGYNFPLSRLVVNLSPADLKKDGSYLDLGICIGILKNKVSKVDSFFDETVFLGELSLNGDIKKVNGILSIVLSLIEHGINRFFIPSDNFMECSEIIDVDVIPVDNVRECVKLLNMQMNDLKKYSNSKKEKIISHLSKDDINDYSEDCEYDFINIKGNSFAKRCIEIAISGGHNIMLIGPPGTGKTMLSKSISTILPELDKEESIEVTKIYSVAGKLGINDGLIRKRPFRQPHHTSTRMSIIGGGVSASVGEITLAHKGVLFFDELPEFDRRTIESMRQPIEDGKINISRVNNTVTYPSDFIFVSTCNPCPCGYYNSSKPCICKESEISRYRHKISGPILDRIDLFCEVSEINYDDMNSSNDTTYSSKKMKKRIESARYIQKNRNGMEYRNGVENKNILNGNLSTGEVMKYCDLDEESADLLKKLHSKYNMSNRSYLKVLKVSRTIADLDNREKINKSDIMEAFSYRRAYIKYFNSR